MTDHLTSASPATWTWRQISKSIAESGLRRCRSGEAWSQLAAYLRHAIRRRDWWEGVRHEQTPPHEQALAVVLLLQEFFRRCDGRLNDGTPRGRNRDGPRPILPPWRPEDVPIQVCEYVEPPDPREARLPWELASDDDEAFGYRGDAGHTNGGISGFEAVHELDDEKNDKPIYGVAAFSSVVGCDGEPELAWYHCASGFELGLSSNFDAMLQALVTGGPSSGGSGVAPTGPDTYATNAAGRQRRVRETLRQLTPAQRCILEIAYEDRRCSTEDLGEFGHGAVLLVARARAAQRDLIQSEIGQDLRGLQIALMWAHGHGRRKRHPWDALSTKAARALLCDAHDAFRAATSTPTRPTRKKRSRNRSGAFEELRPVQTPAYRRGLVEVEVVAA